MDVKKYALLNGFILFLLFFLPVFCRAQITGLKNYTQEDGLNSSFGYRIRQDPKGFLWIGGDNGLFRFDGTEFKHYNTKSGFENTEILGCEPLLNGEIFVIPFMNGFGILKNNTFFAAEHHAELKKIRLGNTVPFIASNTSMNRFFICNPNEFKSGYLYQDGKVSEISVFPDAARADTNAYCLLYDFPRAMVYFLNDSCRIMAYNAYTKQKTPCNLRVTYGNLVSGHNRFIVTKQEDSLMVYELKAPFLFKKINAFPVHEKIYHVYIDDADKLWVGLERGGVLYFDHVSKDSLSPVKPVLFLEDYMINDLLRDRDGNMWFNTKSNGVFFLPAKAFNNYIHLPVKNNSSYLTAITANKTSVFLGGNTSLGSIYHSRELTELTLDTNKFECRAIFANENVCIFGQSRNAFLVNLSDHRIERLPELGTVKNIIPYIANSVLICTNRCVYEFNYVTRKLDLLVLGKTYTALFYDADGLFLGDFKDLYTFNIKTKQKKMFLQGYYFSDLKAVSPDLYIGATKNSGILFFNSSGILRKITEDDGLASNQIKKIEVENEHTFWVSTGVGLSWIRLAGDSTIIQNFTRIDGLPSDLVAGCVIRNDTIYVATSKGLGIFRVNELLNQEKSINKEVIINSVSVGEQEFFEPFNSFTTSYPDNTIVFNLSFLDYASQGKISYRYKTEGLNEGWQISNSSKIILNSLPPGKYTFKVYGLGYNGKQSEHFTAFSFEIKPRFWQSAWFYVAVVLALASLIVLLVAYFVKKRRDKKIRSLMYEKKIAELELQAIKAQINPHFIYNCLNSIQFLLYKKDYEETENYLDVFSKMIRKTLLYSEKTFMPIREEMDYLALYLDMEKLQLQGSFSYRIHVAANVDENWQIPSLLIQPFVENAIKHGVSRLQGREGMIEVFFEYSRPQLSISIRDNGLGIKDKSLLSKKLDSFGIKLSRKRIEAFRQLFDTDITIEIHDLSEKGQPGTEIKLNLNLTV